MRKSALQNINHRLQRENDALYRTVKAAIVEQAQLKAEIRRLRSLLPIMYPTG